MLLFPLPFGEREGTRGEAVGRVRGCQAAQHCRSTPHLPLPDGSGPRLTPERRGKAPPYPRKPAAARAFASTSGIDPPVTQLPPTHSTGLNASQSGADASVIPPVGQKRA